MRVASGPGAGGDSGGGPGAGILTFLLVALTVLWTTARHEASHALVVWLQGGVIDDMALLPGIHPEAGFYFGYVIHSGDTTWLVDAAPYLADLALLLLVLFLTRVKLDWGRYRTAVLYFGVISPLVNLIYGYQGGLWRPATDVADLRAILPPPLVHLYFAAAIGLAIYLLRWLRRIRRTPPQPA